MLPASSLKNSWCVSCLNRRWTCCLKIRTKTGEHTLKYCRWNNELRPFRSLKKRVANIFCKRNSMSDDTRGTSSQSIINTMERESGERSIVNDSVRSSIHSHWIDLFPVDIESEYRKIHGNRKRPDTKACATIPSTTPPAKVAALPPASPTKLKNNQKHKVGAIYIKTT